ncbi:MAG: DUF4244 domain-containing protein [Ornithinimicrobium sp.]
MKIRHGARRARHLMRHEGGEAGMTTAEYAVGTLAACALAAVLMAVVQSGVIKSLISTVIETALSVSL